MLQNLLNQLFLILHKFPLTRKTNINLRFTSQKIPCFLGLKIQLFFNLLVNQLSLFLLHKNKKTNSLKFSPFFPLLCFLTFRMQLCVHLLLPRLSAVKEAVRPTSVVRVVYYRGVSRTASTETCEAVTWVVTHTHSTRTHARTHAPHTHT